MSTFRRQDGCAFKLMCRQTPLLVKAKGGFCTRLLKILLKKFYAAAFASTFLV